MLEITDLDAFYGDAQALWGVSLDVHSGDTVSVLGPNGAGKSRSYTPWPVCTAGVGAG